MSHLHDCPAPTAMAHITFAHGRLIPHQELKELELCQVLIAEIPAKLTHALICQLGNSLPLTDYKHLKRVRNVAGKAGYLDMIIAGPEHTQQILIHLQTITHSIPEQANTSQPSQAPACNPPSAPPTTKASTLQTTDGTCSQNPATQPKQPSGTADKAQLASLMPAEVTAAAAVILPSSVAALLSQHALQLRLAQVPAIAPQTRQQWEQWGIHWPITYKIPDGTAPPTGDQLLASPTDQAYFEEQLRTLLQTVETSEHGQCNAARIVDPLSKCLVAAGVDGREHHPLHHAAVVAVQAASQRDLELWPDQDDNQVGGAICEKTLLEVGGQQGEGGQARIMECDALDGSIGTGCGNKRQKLSTGGREQGMDQRAVVSFTAASQNSGQQGNGLSRPSSSHSLLLPPRPYMCTGYDCFLLCEPCVMCAMALVHSRVSRVIFCRQDKTGGALGGRLSLMKQRSLNHHYQVYFVEAKDL